ncbi:soluble epoxide hydrolase [Variibacter gotjawalensis]|uniref:Soluble epoxide hydrolase n=1 Tax=Variibacter gotjawalensis TaxID=1333996 RepID=A0A0S3PZJ0_9BRAD|nr:alpha/beta hydrolase [Variibacter gotjawalensis]NIK47207.1 pimeloyl-ACP methyl ester carboxylesterase [Variibacter gotjawalensis]RZS49107.1 pimeloyl-ACP methyl ester carboxylesterase [Variibacter gotjawalensis]BAT61369.1 soluble epoxide hydrolase [Variibacter gotjawalensis]
MIKHDYIDANGIRFHYAHAGEGKLMLFLHGFPEFWYCWKDLLPEFGKDHHAVAPDMRGYNLTDKPQDIDSYDIKILVEDMRAFAKALGHDKFILVAHDWGGGVAWSMAIKHPELIEKLVIINSPHPGCFLRELANNPKQQKKSQYMVQFLDPNTEKFLAANNYKALQDIVIRDGVEKGEFTEEDRAEYIKAWSQPGALTGNLNYYRHSKAGPPHSGQPARTWGGGANSLEVKVPTLVIWGENDIALVKENLDGLEEFVPDVTIKRIAGGSHWLIHEVPDQIAKDIRAFIAR